MQTIKLELDDLIVNPENDRHGDMLSEEGAIAWLFERHPRHMQNLALRIVEEGRLFDPPLVTLIDGQYIVRDGNRRVTCLKLIKSPERAPKLARPFFSALTKKAEAIDTSILCQYEPDNSIADKIVELRHTGSHEGEGQLKWDNRAKANHSNRVSGNSEYKLAQQIEALLIEEGFEAEAKLLKRTVLERLLSNNEYRDQVGITSAKGEPLEFRQSKSEFIKLVRNMISDMQNKTVTLQKVWGNEEKQNYIATLNDRELLPAASNIDLFNGPQNQGVDAANDQSGKPSIPKGPKKPYQRSTLIPNTCPANNLKAGHPKISIIWEELQFRLTFSKHQISIAAVFRILIEFLSSQCIWSFELEDQKKLSRNLIRLMAHYESLGKIDRQQFRDLQRTLHDDQSLLSIANLQRFLHSTTQMPSADELCKMWDNLSPLIFLMVETLEPVRPEQGRDITKPHPIPSK